jgi:hypothetical protein
MKFIIWLRLHLDVVWPHPVNIRCKVVHTIIQPTHSDRRGGSFRIIEHRYMKYT